METALWILAICELIKMVGGILGAIAQAKLDRIEQERKRKFTEQIKEFNRHTESVKRMRDADKIDYDEFWHREGHGFTMRVCQKAQQIIEEQPTILEAEEE